MKLFTALAILVCLSGCANPPTAPSVTHAAGTDMNRVTTQALTADMPLPVIGVTLFNGAVGLTSCEPAPGTDPQPPLCTWRNMVVCKHIAWGGNKNDIVRLANNHLVYLRDTWDGGYELFDYPRNWCS